MDSLEDALSCRPDRYLGPAERRVAGEPETCSISARLLSGERVMVGGVADPPSKVVEDLARAAGAQVRDVEEEKCAQTTDLFRAG